MYGYQVHRKEKIADINYFLDENYTNAHKCSQKGHVLSESDKYTVHNYILFIMEFNGNVFKMRVQR